MPLPNTGERQGPGLPESEHSHGPLCCTFRQLVLRKTLDNCRRATPPGQNAVPPCPARHWATLRKTARSPVWLRLCGSPGLSICFGGMRSVRVLVFFEYFPREQAHPKSFPPAARFHSVIPLDPGLDPAAVTWVSGKTNTSKLSYFQTLSILIIFTFSEHPS